MTTRRSLFAAAWPLAAWLYFVGSQSVVPAAVIYSEVVSGDLPENGFAAPLIVLATGANEILGNTGLGATTNDFDSFAIRVPVGTQLTSATFSATRTAGTLVNASWLIYNGPAYTSPQIGVLAGINIPASGLQFLSANLPLGPGQYTFAAAGLTPGGPRPAFASYTFAFQVASIPGSSQAAPILPSDATAAGAFVFTSVASGSWVDPPLVEGFHYEMTTPGSLFTGITGFPTGFSGPFTVSVGGTVLGSFLPGQTLTFAGGGVSSFDVTGITPLADAGSPTAFPLQLTFSTPTASFTMQGIEAVPEPGTLFAWAGLGLAALVGTVRSAVGEKVREARGLLAGLVGTVREWTAESRCVLEVEGLPEGVLFVVDEKMLEAQGVGSRE